MIACGVAALVDYHFWQRTWWISFALSLTGLAFCFLPPFRHRINGSWRWLEFHGITCQPSEFAKMAAVFFLAFWFSRYEAESKQFWRGFVFPMAIVSLLVALIITEVDLGTTVLIGATSFVVMFIAGTNLARDVSAERCLPRPADVRGQSIDELLARLVAVIVADDLFAAILDDAS